MNNEPKPTPFEKLVIVIAFSFLFFVATYVGTNEINKPYAARYCMYNSSSKICQKLAETCTITPYGCMDYTSDPIPAELLNNLSYTQIDKMSNRVKEAERKRAKKANEYEKGIQKEFHSIKIN